MNTFELKGKVRENLGKKATKSLRKEGRIPCELYSRTENVHFSVTPKEIKKLVYTADFYKVNVDVEGKNFEAILKDMQFHPVTDKLLHMDFLVLDEANRVTVDLPIKLTGLAEGVKEGGTLMQKLRTLKVKALPKDLIDSVSLDVSEVELGKSIKVEAIKLDNVEIINPMAIPIASVEIPRALRSAQAGEEGEEAEEGATAAEGEEKTEEK